MSAQAGPVKESSQSQAHERRPGGHEGPKGLVQAWGVMRQTQKKTG